MDGIASTERFVLCFQPKLFHFVYILSTPQKRVRGSIRDVMGIKHLKICANTVVLVSIDENQFLVLPSVASYDMQKNIRSVPLTCLVCHLGLFPHFNFTKHEHETSLQSLELRFGQKFYS